MSGAVQFLSNVLPVELRFSSCVIGSDIVAANACENAVRDDRDCNRKAHDTLHQAALFLYVSRAKTRTRCFRFTPLTFQVLPAAQHRVLVQTLGGRPSGTGARQFSKLNVCSCRSAINFDVERLAFAAVLICSSSSRTASRRCRHQNRLSYILSPRSSWAAFGFAVRRRIVRRLSPCWLNATPARRLPLSPPEAQPTGSVQCHAPVRRSTQCACTLVRRSFPTVSGRLDVRAPDAVASC